MPILKFARVIHTLYPVNHFDRLSDHRLLHVEKVDAGSLLSERRVHLPLASFIDRNRFGMENSISHVWLWLLDQVVQETVVVAVGLGSGPLCFCVRVRDTVIPLATSQRCQSLKTSVRWRQTTLLRCQNAFVYSWDVELLDFRRSVSPRLTMGKEASLGI